MGWLANARRIRLLSSLYGHDAASVLGFMATTCKKRSFPYPPSFCNINSPSLGALGWAWWQSATLLTLMLPVLGYFQIMCLCLHAVNYIYIYAFSRRFYPKRLTLHSSFYILSALAFPGNRTHDLGVASAMLYQLSYRKAPITTANNFLSMFKKKIWNAFTVKLLET